MCGDVSRWAVPSVSLCACRVCVSGRSVYRISTSLASRYASLSLSQIRIHDTHTQGGYGLPSPLTAHTQRGCGLAGLPSPLCAHTLTHRRHEQNIIPRSRFASPSLSNTQHDTHTKRLRPGLTARRPHTHAHSPLFTSHEVPLTLLNFGNFS